MTTPAPLDLLLVDGHNDLAWAHREIAAYDLDTLDVAEPQPMLHTDLPRLRAGGVRAQFWSVYVPSTLVGDAAVRATREQVRFVHRLVERYDALALAGCADDVERVVASGRIASLMGMEGGHSIGGSLEVLAQMYDDGVRYLTLTHNDNLPWADSATDEPVLGGLGPFGREVVASMNDLGMAVDLSHVSAGVMHDALDCTRAPVLFSHSNARAVCDVPRNVPDDVLARLADNGGVCMATFVPQFTRQDVADWHAQDRSGEPPRSRVADVVAHVEHIRDVVGVEHVGIGGDFDGTARVTDGLGDVSTYPVLFAALADRGWSHHELDLLAGRNVLRALRDVETAADR